MPTPAGQAFRDKYPDPLPINMDHMLVACWECGLLRQDYPVKKGTARDDWGHSYCGEHLHLWGKQPPDVWSSAPAP